MAAHKTKERGRYKLNPLVIDGIGADVYFPSYMVVKEFVYPINRIGGIGLLFTRLRGKFSMERKPKRERKRPIPLHKTFTTLTGEERERV